jgi:uncharacterized membrane protein YidH (DUF202 family)
MWQDVILTIINFGFIITVIPAIVRNYQLKDVRGQSILMYLSTTLLLAVVAYIFFTLEMFLSSLSTAGSAFTWFILTYQKIKYDPK